MTQSKTKILKQNVISQFHTHYEHVYSMSDKMLKSRENLSFLTFPRRRRVLLIEWKIFHFYGFWYSRKDRKIYNFESRLEWLGLIFNEIMTFPSTVFSCCPTLGQFVVKSVPVELTLIDSSCFLSAQSSLIRIWMMMLMYEHAFIQVTMFWLGPFC